MPKEPNKFKLIKAFEALNQKELVAYLKNCKPESFTPEEITKFLCRLIYKYPQIMKDPRANTLKDFINNDLEEIQTAQKNKRPK